MTRRTRSFGLLIALLTMFAAAKTQLDIGLGPSARDADYYFTIARSIALGEGLRSTLSLYYQGFKEFPHLVTQSPVWPVVLGFGAKIFGLGNLTTTLPVILYLLDLMLVYFLALRLRERMAEPAAGWFLRQGRLPDIGHVAVLILGSNIVFFRFTSVPNNEAIAYCFVISGLIALDRAVTDRSLGWAGVAGLLGTTALLTRVQALGFALAVPLVFAWLALSDRRYARLAPATLVGGLLPFVPWVAYLASEGLLSFRGALGMETLRMTPELPVFEHAVILPTLWDVVKDRASGLLVAFDPRGFETSYTFQYAALAYAAPLAAAHAAVGWLRTRSLPGYLLPARLALPAATLIAGLGMLAPVHTLHMAIWSPWLFGFRHGIPLLFLILPALVYLDTRAGRAWRVVAALMVVGSIAASAVGVKQLLDRPFNNGPGEFGWEIIQWLDVQDPRPSVVTTHSWDLAPFSLSGYHWTQCMQPPEDTLTLLTKARADYVAVYPVERKCNFVRGLRPHSLRLVKEFGKGGAAIRLLALRDPDDAAP